MKEFDLTIVSSGETVHRGPAVYLGITTPEGTAGLEADHQPFLALLAGNSEIHWQSARPGNSDRPGETFPEGQSSPEGRNSLRAASGLVNFRDNRCTVTITLPPEPAES